jgi:patatin-like phospholipase/acyl hydrolase
VLADFFDYVAGTSTGAVISVCVSLGFTVEQMRNFYLAGGLVMFESAPLFKRYFAQHVDDKLSAKLRDVLSHTDGRQPAEKLLGDEDLRTLLLVVMRNSSTDSPWPISNNPKARYNDRSREDCNLNIPLWQIVRASTAAPIFFPPQPISIGGQRRMFVDGALTVYNNPAFALFLMATLPEYRLNWNTGEDEMLLVSVGTGMLSGELKALAEAQMGLLYNLKNVPSALIDAALSEQDKLCRIFGRCRFGDPIDREIGDLIVSDEKAAQSGLGPFGPKKFTYVRYNPQLTEDGIKALGFTTFRAEDVKNVQRLTSSKYMPQLMAVGRRYAERLDLAHLGSFDPRRSP